MKLTSLFLLIMAAIVSAPAMAEYIKHTLIDDAKVSLQFRARFEQVDLADHSNEDQTTIRSRLTYQSGELVNFFVLAEIDDVRSTNNEPLIADYKYTEINQSFLGYKAPASTLLKYGRQRILLDNQRFVGGVGFRQNEQTYDSFTTGSKGLKDFNAFYAYINNVNRIFSEDSGKSDHKNKTHLLNLQYSGREAANITGYTYLLDNQNEAGFSTNTYGLRLTGKQGWDDYKLNYELEYATQTDAKNNTLNYSADYLLAQLAINYDAVGVKLGYEVLGSDEGKAGFITPLATLHAFQGWTDKFLFGGAGNWDQGIKDAHISLNGKFAGVSMLAVYHKFDSDEESIDMGQEWGVRAGYIFAKYYKASAKYASFRGADSGYSFSEDTDKFWLTLEARYGCAKKSCW